MIKVGITGALGKMGREVVEAVNASNDCELVLAVDIAGIGTEISKGVFVESDLEAGIDKTNPDVIVDFTQPDNVYKNVKTYIGKGIKSVIGTTGLMPEQIQEIEKLSEEKQVGVIIAPNFSIGAVLMMMFSGMAAKYFDNAEILEFHHNQKKDAPSGTAIKTAEIMRREKDNFTLGNCPEKETMEGARGANHDGNIRIHSIRMPGYVASQEVVFGSSGQTLKIRHDSIDRKCYMSGVLLAIRNVFENNKFIYGLENILWQIYQ